MIVISHIIPLLIVRILRFVYLVILTFVQIFLLVLEFVKIILLNVSNVNKTIKNFQQMTILNVLTLALRVLLN